MPYIKPERRVVLDPKLEQLSACVSDVGELNYAVTRLAMRRLRSAGLNYINIAGVVGTLVLVVFELVRRVVNHYETAKILENGDVQEYDATYPIGFIR